MPYPSDKYFGEQGESHPGELHWPGVHGLPFLGDTIPNLKKDELDEMPVVGYAHHRVFDLSKQAESDQYRDVRDRIRNGLFTLDYIHREWNQESQSMLIYLEWTQLYRQNTPSHGGAANGNGQSPTRFTLG